MDPRDLREWGEEAGRRINQSPRRHAKNTMRIAWKASRKNSNKEDMKNVER
jgi:hypothetical protein